MPSETFLFADDLPPAKQPQKPSPAQRMLDWLQRWPKDTITVRQLRIYGPRVIRDQKSAILDAAEILVANGWLVPTKPSWPGTQAWQIVRRNIVNPPVAM